MSFSVNGRGNPLHMRIQIGDPIIGPATFKADRRKPFAQSNFGVPSTTRSVQKFPPRQLPQGKARTEV